MRSNSFVPAENWRLHADLGMQVWDFEHRLYEVAMRRLLCELCRLASCRQDTSYSQYKDHGGDKVKIVVPKRPEMICDSF